jgi:hypothetical protein
LPLLRAFVNIALNAKLSCKTGPKQTEHVVAKNESLGVVDVFSGGITLVFDQHFGTFFNNLSNTENNLNF